MLPRTGLQVLIFKSDQQPQILDLKNMEASPVNEHQSNGVVERAVKTVGATIRPHKLALEQSHSKELEADHVEIP